MRSEVFNRYAERLKEVILRERMSKETYKSYRSCLRGYANYLCGHNVEGFSKEEKVSGFLSTLSEKSASTQKQNLNALCFFYQKVLNDPFGKLPDWVRAHKPKRLPTWLTSEECLTLFRHMKGQNRLMAELMFGSGLRLKEAVELRLQDLDLSSAGVKVRSGKGDKSRVTCLPKSLIPALREHLETCREIWAADRLKEVAPVPLPNGLERKYPNAGQNLEWFWLFPAHGLVRSAAFPVRWHVHPQTIGKSLSSACKKAVLGKKVTAHTLRHSFATASLMAGMPIHELKELMGHSSIRTTEIYLHCLPLVASRSQSPLDAALMPDRSKVLAFPQSSPALAPAAVV